MGGKVLRRQEKTLLCKNNLPGGRLCGCRNVKEFVPSVRLARFHRESLPSLLGRSAGGEILLSSGSDG